MILVIARLRLPSIALAALFSIVAAAPAHASSSKDGAKAGAVLFRDKGCAHCHGVGGIGGKKAPSLVDIRKNKLWPADKITGQIMNGGQKMPPFGDALTDRQIAQLVDYLRAKHRPIPPPAADEAPPPAPGP